MEDYRKIKISHKSITMPGPYPTGRGSTLGRLRAKIAAKKAENRRGKKFSSFAKKVLAVVNRKEETKYVSQQIQQQVPMGQALVTPAGLFNCLASVTQGVGDYQRVGEKISPVRAAIDFSFNWTNDQSNNQDVVVNLWIVTAKGLIPVWRCLQCRWGVLAGG